MVIGVGIRILLVVVLSMSDVGASATVNYIRRGVMAWNVGPPTPIWWPPNPTGRMLVFESARYCRPNDTYWPPNAGGGELQPYSNKSYFRIRDLVTGAVVTNVAGSEGYAYGSAVVDPTPPGRMWVFGTPMDLCHRNESRKGNYVRAWWSDDLVSWYTTRDPAVSTPRYPFNTDVTVVTPPSPSLPGVKFVMVYETGGLAVHDGPDRNLSTGWKIVASDTGLRASASSSSSSSSSRRGFGACPSVHYAVEDGYFYVISGGTVIALSRSKDLQTWEQAKQKLVTPLPHLDSVLSPYMGIRAQAAASEPLRRVVANPNCWEFDVNDADFCCQAGSGAPNDTAFVLYSPSSQGHPARTNCSHLGLESLNFNGIATSNVSLTTLLQSYF